MLAAAEIRAALAAGHTMRWVFEQQQDRLSFGYVQFTRYVKKFINEACSAVPARPGRIPAAVPKHPFPLASSTLSEPRRGLPEAPKRFHFDPMSVDRKDLV
jgi:hypothetical protein